MDTLTIIDSSFETIPWPGFHIFNATQAIIRNNVFKSIAGPRSIAVKKGHDLEVSRNALPQVASTLDVSQFLRMAIFCNHPKMDQVLQQCHKGKVGQASRRGLDSLLMLYGLFTASWGHFCILLVLAVIVLVSTTFR